MYYGSKQNKMCSLIGCDSIFTFSDRITFHTDNHNDPVLKPIETSDNLYIDDYIVNVTASDEHRCYDCSQRPT